MFWAKRAFDIAGAGLALIVLAPAFAIISLLVLIDSGRPVFFHQRRIGRNRQAFTMFKFRTMPRGPTSAGQRAHRRGPRRHRGRLRRHEAPVGRLDHAGGPDPAPHQPRRAAAALERRAGRHEPGRTPPAAPVRGGRPDRLGDHAPGGPAGHHRAVADPGTQRHPWNERMQLDYSYVRHWSLSDDARIVASTLPAVLRKRGSR